MSTHRRSGIVVGIEGTAASEAALEWAIREAVLRDCPVIVVHAWDFVVARDAGRMTEHEEKIASACLVDAAVATAVRVVGATPEVVSRSLHGSPARVLLAAAEEAVLLVLGRGHRSGAVDMLGHSVSAECVRRATCPVVVIPTAAVDHQSAYQHPVTAGTPAHS